MPRTCHACGRHLKPHRHGKRNHCSSRCARLLARFEKDRKRSRGGCDSASLHR